jgi:hypothetical protein
VVVCNLVRVAGVAVTLRQDGACLERVSQG